MSTNTLLHFVFVDFENVQELDLTAVARKPVQVILLIGKNQTKLDFDLVHQIHQLAEQVELVKLGASGRNALDLTLACYLGRAVEREPAAHFHIVSKDKDFDPMIAHLVEKEINVVRCDSFSALSFLPKPRKAAVPRVAPAAKPTPHPKASAAGTIVPVDDRLEKLINRLRNNSAPRPKKKPALLAHISTAFGGKLPEAEQTLKLEELIRRGVLSIGDKDRINYP